MDRARDFQRTELEAYGPSQRLQKYDIFGRVGGIMPPVRTTDTVHFTFLKIRWLQLSQYIGLYRTFLTMIFVFGIFESIFVPIFIRKLHGQDGRAILVRHNSFNILNDSCQISVLHKEKLQWKRRNGFFFEIDVFVSTFLSHNCHRHHNRGVLSNC